MKVVIKSAYAEKEEISRLFSEYTQMLMDEDPQIARCLQVQGYQEELGDLRKKYGEPEGRLYILYVDDKAAGCVGMRKLTNESCEMKRLFVRPEYRSHGLGRKLAERILAEAEKEGYREIFLDTFSFLREAVSLYEKMGFWRIDSYNDNPLDYAIYMKADVIKTNQRIREKCSFK